MSETTTPNDGPTDGPAEHRTPGAPPAMMRSENLPRSNRKRWYLHVYHPDLTPAERTELDAHAQSAPIYVLGIPTFAGLTVLTLLAATSGEPDLTSLVLAALAVPLAGLAGVCVRSWAKGRGPVVAIKAAFKATHPAGEQLVRYTSMEETERPAIAAVEAAIAKLAVSSRDREAALHQRLWLAARGRISPLDITELTELTAGRRL